MKELISSIISLILLVPIMCFSPLGLSKQGKGILVVTAFIIANVGLLAKLNFALWQTVLLILLLAIFTGYIIDKRLGRMVYDKNQLLERNNEFESPDFSLSEKELPIELDEDSKSKISNVPIENGVYATQFVEEPFLNEVSTEKEQMQQDESTSLSTKNETFESAEPVFEQILDKKIDLNQHEVEVELEEIPLEDISFLNNRNEMIHEQMESDDSTQHVQNDEELENIDYMFEIENMLQNDDLERFQTIENKQIEESTFVGEEVIDPEIDWDETPGYVAEDKHDDPNLYTEYIKQAAPPIENIAQSDELEVLHSEEIEQDENVLLLGLGVNEDPLELDQTTNNEIEAEQEISNIYSIYVEQAAPVIENLELTPVVEDSMDSESTTTLQQQLFSTMINQLQLSRKHMESLEYELLIKEHLHEDLTAHDYYTFSSLLIEHYISNKENNKLESLLEDLKERFSLYPILEMEIQYLYDRYCKKLEAVFS